MKFLLFISIAVIPRTAGNPLYSGIDETQLDVQAAGQPARRVEQGRPVTFIQWVEDTPEEKLAY